MIRSKSQRALIGVILPLVGIVGGLASIAALNEVLSQHLRRLVEARLTAAGLVVTEVEVQLEPRGGGTGTCATDIRILVADGTPAAVAAALGEVEQSASDIGFDSVQVIGLCGEKEALGWVVDSRCHALQKVGANYIVKDVPHDLGMGTSTHDEFLALAQEHPGPAFIAWVVAPLPSRWRSWDLRCA